LKKLRRKFYYFGALILSKLVLLIPYKLAVNQVSRALGSLAYFFVWDARAKARKNLALCFPEKSTAELNAILRKVLINQAKNFFELANFPRLKGKFFNEISEMENKDLILKALEGGKGILFSSAHAGNWEITAASVAANGIPVNVIAKRIYIDDLNNLLVSYRNSKNVKVILRSAPDSARKMLKALKNNETLAMLIDQDTEKVQGVFVNFFGRKAYTPSGLAALALRTGTPVFFGVDMRVGEYKHKTVIKGPVTITPTGNTEQDILLLTQKLSDILEDHIRQYPDQWVWFHERWRTQPPAMAQPLQADKRTQQKNT